MIFTISHGLDGHSAASGSGSVQADALLSEFRASAEKSFSLAVEGFSARVNLTALEAWLSFKDTRVSVYPDFKVEALLNESVVQIGADQVWTMQDPSHRYARGSGIVVAVIDTGVDYTHPDLGGGFGPSYKVVGGYDFCNHDSDPMDDNGHGTHVAGIIAANGILRGVAPEASILAYKVLGSDGSGSMSDVVLAIEAAMDPNGDGDTSDHADIISMSLGGPGKEGDPVCTAVRNAFEAGVVVVVAAGNSGPSLGTVASPGIAPEAITVGAVDRDGTLAEFSSRGVMPDLRVKPEISAPGVRITSTVPATGTPLGSPSGYRALSGTSMATPHVSGAAALLLQLHPDWTPARVKSALVTGSLDVSESLWNAGAGNLWVPGAAQTKLFFDDPIVSYGFAGSSSRSVYVSYSGGTATLSASSSDWASANADGSEPAPYWSNSSSVYPASVSISSGSGSMSITVSPPTASAPEGYYEGEVRLTGSGISARLPFGFAVLSRLDVHVMNMKGNEVFDPYGGVWVYRKPDGDVALGVRAGSGPSPPASFLLPSGQYNVHSVGHHLIYTYSDPYVLSKSVSVPRLQTVSVYLNMSDALKMTLDLATEEGVPIYVKDYRVYCRYSSERNLSFDVVGSDYSIVGSEVFSIFRSRDVYVSQTDARVGISVAGFSYTPAMWDFWKRNHGHWFESPGSAVAGFTVEATADLQYLLAWEFDGIDASTSTSLTLDKAKACYYRTKYDVPGPIGNVWGNWGTSLAMGGDATFFTRRNTDTSLNPFFSGMTRTTIVQGVFTELYFPGNLFEGVYSRQYYVADYTHIVRAETMSQVYLPDRYYLQPKEGVDATERIGAGPFYPSVRTQNNATSLVLFHPLLRDQAGLAVGGMCVPSMNLYRNGQLVGIYQLSEYMARTNAMRAVSLGSSGSYLAQISYEPGPDICSDVTINLGFTVPASDMDPPVITHMRMPQRFVQGSTVSIEVGVSDASSVSSLTVSWKSSGTSAWKAASVMSLGGGVYSASILTSSSDASIDLQLKVTDASGNYIEYTATSVAYAQVGVVFELSAQGTEVGYRNGDATVTLTGRLTDALGNPLCACAAVPLELFAGGRKVGTLLDEYVLAGSHTHNGSIRFDWHFNPTNIFTGPGQSVTIEVPFDLGIYEPVKASFVLRSSEYANIPPTIVLESPANNSLIAAGTPIDLEITDDGAVTAVVYVDGKFLSNMTAPWIVSTTSWSDGHHTVQVVATDDMMETVSASFEFDVDASSPTLSIEYPSPGARIPIGKTLVAKVSDMYLASVTYSVNGGAPVELAAPYVIDMSGWSPGNYTVSLTATDKVGRSTTRSVSFEIAVSTVVISLVSPANGAVVRPGTFIILSITGTGSISTKWFENGVWHDIGSATSIQTSSWSEGTHSITINATDELGGSDQLYLTITLDGTAPVISLVSPLNSSFVEKSDVVRLRVADANLKLTRWSLWGLNYSTTQSDISIVLASSPGDGPFTIQVTAEDRAGNIATQSYLFLMDSAPPVAYFAGMDHGSAVVRPGAVLDLVVEDEFLSAVWCAIDDGPRKPLQGPYDIATDGMASGSHVVEIVASDMAGHSTTLRLSLYIDSISPSVQLDAPREFTPDASLVVQAHADDDYGIRAVTLFYELADGSFSAVAMTFGPSGWSATLQPSLLWSGMSMFALATDLAGNSAESSRVELFAALVPPASDIQPPADDTGTGGQEIVQPAGIPLWIVFGAAAVPAGLALGFYFKRRRRLEQGLESEDAGSAGVAPSLLPVPGLLAGNTRLPAWDVPASDVAVSAPGPSADTTPVRSVQQRRLSSRASAKSVDAPADSSSAPRAEPVPQVAADDTVDFGELIERELIIPGLSYSIRKDRLVDT